MIHQFRIYQEEDFSGKIENKLDPKKLENTLTDYFENPYNFYSDSISIEFSDDRKSIIIKITSEKQNHEVKNDLANYIIKLNNSNKIILLFDTI